MSDTPNLPTNVFAGPGYPGQSGPSAVSSGDLPSPNGPIAGGGGPPHPPSMEPRIAVLEAQAKKTEDTLHRIEVTLAGIAPALATLPNKADLATLTEKVSGMDRRLGTAEDAIKDTIKAAVGKAIGPWQLPVIVVGTGGALAVLAAGYHWLIAQSWFPH